MSLTNMPISLTHSLIDAYGRCRCSTVRDDQHKPIQSLTGISIGIIININISLSWYPHTQSLLEYLCIRLYCCSAI